ncbi:MAG: hypothetical protein JRJ73_12120 [Deltaproteobacteria bacterium]|nr:hypothetical protein [Deltaproteobacteria bacterium]
MDLLERMKKKYDGKPLREVEASLLSFKRGAYEAQKNMIDGLWYMERLERHKEDPAYKKSPFKVYMEDRFAMKAGTYDGLRMVFHNYAAEALKYGPGLVQSIGKKCVSTKDVLAQIKAKDAKLKTPISRPQIQAIVNANLKPKAPSPIPVQEPDWRARCEAERRLRVAVESSLEEARGQIKRLKATVFRLKSYQAAIKEASMNFMDDATAIRQ